MCVPDIMLTLDLRGHMIDHFIGTKPDFYAGPTNILLVEPTLIQRFPFVGLGQHWPSMMKYVGQTLAQHDESRWPNIDPV